MILPVIIRKRGTDTMKKTMITSMAFAVSLTASAAEITLQKTSDYNVGFSDTSCWSVSGAPSPGNNYWLLSESKIFYSKAGNKGSESFAGNSLNVGSPSSSSYGRTSGKLALATVAASTVTLPNLIWWSGQVNTGYNGVHLWYGTWTVRQGDVEAYHRTGLNGYQHCYTNFVTLVSSADDANASDAVIELGVGSSGSYPGSVTYKTMSDGSCGFHHFRGDFSAYKGSIDVSAPYQPVVIFNGTIMGDTSVANARAIRLGNNSCIAIGADFAQNANRGIYVYGTQAYFMTWNIVAKEWTLNYPVSGAGNVIKDGPGKVTLACDWTAGDITVNAGTLELAPDASFPAGQNVTVKSGATLVIRRADCLSGFNVSAESGATVVRLPIVGYDSATDNVTDAVSIPADVAPDASIPIPLKLSEAIAVPFHAEKRLAVATIAAGAADFSAEDFVDASDKTCGLPNTSFDVVKEDGTQTVYLVAKPVVVSVQAFADVDKGSMNGHSVNVNTNYWSDDARAHNGSDYLLRHNVSTMGNEDFAGDSLVIAGNTSTDPAIINTRALTNALTKAIVRGYLRIQPNQGNYHVHNVRGDIHIDGTYTEEENYLLTVRGIVGAGGTSQEGVSLLGNITGDGAINFLAAQAFASPITHALSGDNSGFTGRLRVGTTSGSAAFRRTSARLRFASPESLGGSPSVFRFSAIDVTSGSMLVPERTMTLDAENRGIYVRTGGFEVPDGVTLTVKTPLRVDGALYKLGEGVLALDCPLSYGEQGTSASKNFIVEEGGICAICDVAVSNLKMTMSNETAIVLCPSSAVTNGIMGSLSVPEGKVRVVLDPASMPADSSSVTASICTLAASLGDQTALFDVVRPKGYSAKLVKMSITIDGVEYTRYSVRYTPRGFTLILS